MGHLLKNAFRWKIRNWVCIFWPLVFPLLLGTFFYLALGNIGKAETMQAIPTAVVMEEGNPEEAYFTQFLDAVSQGENPILKPAFMSWDEASAALRAKSVHGIIRAEAVPSLTVAESDIESSILEAVLRMYTGHAEVIRATVQSHPENLPAVIDAMKMQTGFTKTVSLGGTSLDPSTQFYYALIAMACLYGVYIGLMAAMKLQANISPLGMRQCISPTHKMKLIVSELVSSFVLHMINMVILLAVLRYVYRVSLGGNTGYTLLITAFGVLIGVCFGFFIGAVVKGNEGLKVGIVTGFSLIASACAGLMAPNVKISIQRSVPFLNQINPASVITDALYFVHIYSCPARMWKCLAILGSMSLMLVAASFFATRRERYAGI